MTPGVLFATLAPIAFLILVGLGQLLIRAGRDRSRLDGVEGDIKDIKGDVKFLVRRLTGNASQADHENQGMGRR